MAMTTASGLAKQTAFVALTLGLLAGALYSAPAFSQVSINRGWQPEQPSIPSRTPMPPAVNPADRPYLPPSTQDRQFDVNVYRNGSTGPDRRATPPPSRYPAEPADRFDESFGANPADDGWGPGIESNDLPPVTAAGQTRLGTNPWDGTTVDEVERLIAQLKLPPRSSVLHDLWVSVITSPASPAQSKPDGMPFSAIQSEALYRSGMLDDAYRVTQATGAPENSNQLLIDVIQARAAIASGNGDNGCPVAKTLVRKLDSVPKSLRGDAIMMIGFCAVYDKNQAAAGLAADFAEDNGLSGSPGVAALRAYSVGSSPTKTTTSTPSVIEFQIMQTTGARLNRTQLENATPALLAAVALARTVAPDIQIAAGELALSANAISERDLTDVYRNASPRLATASRSDAQFGQNFGDELRRAQLFNSAEQDQNPLRKARNIRGFLDAASRAGFYWHALRMMAAPANQLALLPEIGWFAETGIEVSLAAGDTVSARRWATFAAAQSQIGGTSLEHWQGLIAIADPGKHNSRMGPGLQHIENAAQRGLFAPDQLHRLATVLDALDAQVPIPLWELASRTPQPSTGHLPATGVLSALQAAAKSNQIGKLVLLELQTLGPNGAEGAHMIALGDAIRALKRAGKIKQARRLAIEALFGRWPRAVSY